jgi:phosphoadenosine phosphosulfate reductase
MALLTTRTQPEAEALDPEILSLEAFLAARAASNDNQPRGVRIEPADRVEQLSGHLDGVSRIDVAFPGFRDGRGYSSARILRARLGYRGELRAVGDVLLDQLHFMARAGFDAFEVANADEDTALTALARYPIVYQHGADARPVRRAETIQERLARLNQRFRRASPAEIIGHAIRTEFRGGIALVSSFGAEAAVSLALAADVSRDVPVLFLDTGMHFQQTLDYREALTQRLGLTNVRILTAEKADVAADDPKGALNQTNPDRCCLIRKTLPLDRGLVPFDAWITGRKRIHGGDRMTLAPFEYDDGRFKVNPLVGMSAEDIEAFFIERDLPRHPLVAEGYRSIGCWPCTEAVESEDVRAGRWKGQNKRECGIHRPRVRAPVGEGL